MKTYKKIVVIMLACWALSFAQDYQPYKIGVSDRLSISFWQEPDLDTEVRVNENGIITLPIIGDIKAAGLTTNQLSKSIVEQVSFYNPRISQATVVVTEYNSQTVVLSGEINEPGEYHFERIPNLLDVIRQAGGATSSADLSRVTIIRQEDNKAKIIEVDVLDHLRKGDLAGLPQLKAKDMINIPVSPYGGITELLVGPTFKGKNVYFIYGAVNDPGVKNLSENLELVDAIAAAGGITELSDTKNISIVMKDVKYSSVLSFNLDEYIKKGQPARYKLHPEDTIIIPFRRERTFWSRLPEYIIPGLVTSIATAIIIRRYY
ncbi:MAG: hypothetical protein DRP26_02025 [Candidatus Zixiibacteriota bacterium]|nr:MAG: hypothetical protein DRP26_02025 [candidate division Zixibacteria bacterium]